ncbi:MAG: TDP-N-acetylfucosamine:lipid II N-acetylfucosaminyltransferase [Bacteroidales bacterium]
MRENKNELIGKHCFIFITDVSYKNFDTVDCKYVYNFFKLFKLFLFSKRNDRFILHSYMHPYLYLFSLLTFWNLKKMIWIIWGGDLYFYREPKFLKYQLYEFFRKCTIKKFKYILGLKGDYLLAQEYYKVKGSWLDGVVYPLHLDEGFKIENEENHTLRVLLGNSADPSNNHIEALEMLSRFNHLDMKVFVPLSYGGTPEYIKMVDKAGINLLSDKYIAVKKYMRGKEYNEFLSTIDIMICNHNRQQALGNIFALFNMGKKIFIRDGITTVDLLNEYKLKFFITQDIERMGIDELAHYDLEDKVKNQTIVRLLYSNSRVISLWNKIFQKITQC